MSGFSLYTLCLDQAKNMTTLNATALEYCLEKNGAAPSSLHYALLFQSLEKKAFWLGCFTLHHELRQACLKQLDAGLTQVKLGWWVNSLGNAARETNLHPVIRAIGLPQLQAMNPENWSDLVAAVENSCKVSRFDHFDAWADANRHELMWWLPMVRQAGQLSANETHDQDAVAFWAHSGQLAQLLRLAKYVDEQFNPLPLNWLEQFNVTHADLKARLHNASTTGLFTFATEQILKVAEQRWRNLPEDWRLHLRPLRALYRMRVAEMNQLKSKGLPLLREQALLTPMKKFTLSWTTQVLRR